jgi:hypothetical protein
MLRASCFACLIGVAGQLIGKHTMKMVSGEIRNFGEFSRRARLHSEPRDGHTLLRKE